MKKLTILSTVALLFFITSCSTDKHKDEQNQSEETHENHDPTTAVQLDNGGKWMANVETTQGIQSMTQMVEGAQADPTSLAKPFSNGEHFDEIKEDLSNLIKLGVKIESITTDGHKSILKAIKKSLPDALSQRCLVHIQRMCLLWLTRFPKHLAGMELRWLVLQLLDIRSDNDRLHWTQQLRLWYERHKVKRKFAFGVYGHP
jgi:hypothetical protein